MAARAIYKAILRVGDLELPVKFYAAVEERAIPFRLLHEADHEPIVQELIDKTTEEPVAREEVRKAYQLEDQRLVRLEPDELEGLQPEASRTIRVSHFLSASAIDHSLYDRPYYLGPDGDEAGYFALARALAQRKREGLARWVMRGRTYVGALRHQDGYLAILTLRSADEVIDIGSFARPEKKELSKQELQLARQLIETLEGEFEPRAFHNEYREQVRKLIERKASGQVIPIGRAKKKAAATPALAEALEQSLRSLKKRTRAER